MRAVVNLAIVLTLLTGCLVTAIALPESRVVVDDLLISYPQESKEWVQAIAETPFKWAFFLASTLALLLWLRPQKHRPSNQPQEERREEPESDDNTGDGGEALAFTILVGLVVAGVYFWFNSTSQDDTSDARKNNQKIERAAEALAAAEVFLRQFKKDFCKYDSDTPAALNMAGIPWRLEKHPRNGQHGYTVRMPDALRWARKWLSATDFKLLSRTVDHNTTIWMMDYDLEVY